MGRSQEEALQAEVECLRRETDRLMRENERLQDALRFLPPQSFLTYYSLLVEAVYTTRFPAPEVKHFMRRWGLRIPVRDYRAYRMLRQVDQRLYELSHCIRGFLSGEEDVELRPGRRHKAVDAGGKNLPQQQADKPGPA